ncbi:MAG: hypothetical protein ABI643_03085 [Candidatus Doudnabacteria bacterium]
MKKLLLVLFAAGVLVAGPVFAQMGMMGSGSNTAQIDNAKIEAALQDIYKSQNVTSTTQVNCSKVTDAQFEKLGDASMGYGITEQQHTAMENMMGGEGSATLMSAHINMGKAFLGCWAGYNSAPVAMGMMGNYGSAGFSNSGMMGRGHMGFKGDFGWVHGITMILVWLLLALGIAALVKWLRKH